MKTRVIVLCLLMLAGAGFAQTQHFEPVDPTGQVYNVSARGIYIEGLALQLGDEVGIFDGDLCVGAKIVTQPVNVSAGQFLTIPAQEGDDNLQLPGFTPGNDINVIVWQKHNDTEIDITEEWALGDGTFGSGVAAIMHPIFHGDPSIQGPAHFIPVEPADPQDINTPAYGVVVEMATLDSDPLEPGDEIAVYDGDLCVGAAKLPYVLDDDSSLLFMTWGAYNSADGYTVGNELLVHVWDSSAEIEIAGTPDFYQGATFESDPFAIVSSLQSSDVNDAPAASLPDGFEIVNVYPNPFNAALTVQVALPAPGEVSLAVWDVLGRHVATIAAGSLSAGEHGITWNAAGTPSGVYFVRASFAGEAMGLRKVTLLK
ncbi:T9SS type A sorting domain-containing protein [bacterium]|nr:T9SS type A sorting domain-containing protein [bacterium]